MQTAVWPLGAEGEKWVNGDILKPDSTGVSLWSQNTEQERSSTRGAEALTSTLTAGELTSAMQSTNLTRVSLCFSLSILPACGHSLLADHKGEDHKAPSSRLWIPIISTPASLASWKGFTDLGQN